jgi:hypothetical protein
VIRYVKNWQNVPSAKACLGRWVFQLSFKSDRIYAPGWYIFSFGLYKVSDTVPEGAYMFRKGNYRGFLWVVRIWLPIEFGF